MMPGAELIPKIITDVILEEIPKVPGIRGKAEGEDGCD